MINGDNLLADLELNIADEAEARQGYYNLLADYGEYFSREEIKLIKEIIAEELKHTNILQEMIYRRNGIIPEK